MTPNQQVLSDEQIAALKKGPAQSFLEFARAIESATLAAIAQQAQPGEAVVWLMQAIGTSQFEFARPHQKAMHPHMWTDAFPVYRTTPPAPQPAPVDEREAFEAEWSRHGVKPSYFTRNEFGYLNEIIEASWQGWQARAALQYPSPQTKGQP